MREDNRIILVDLDDKEIGFASKHEVHERGLLHRAFSIFIYNEDYLLIQQRNSKKYHSGGLWTNACCSHPRKNERTEEAIHRRLKEEMGFDCKLNEQFKFVYKVKFSENLYEYEYDHVFLGKYSGDITLNREEASNYKWIKIEKLKEELLNYSEHYTAWFIISAPKIFEILNR